MPGKVAALTGACIALLIMIRALPSTAAEWPDALRIGIYLPMTGPASDSGRKLYAGISIAHETKPALAEGVSVELALIDTAGDVKQSLEAVRTLLNENKVCVVIGEAGERTTRAASIITEQRKIPMITPAVTSSNLTESRNYLFRTCVSDAFQVHTIARYALETLEARRASILIDITSEASINMAESFKNSYTEKGGAVASLAYCASGDQDFTLQISSFMASKPDFLFLPLSYPEVIGFNKKARELGFTLPTFILPGADPSLLVAKGGNSLEGIMFLAHFSPDASASERDKAYTDEFKKKKGYRPGILEILGADAYFVVLDAAERAQSADGKDIKNALAHTRQFPGLSGPISLGKDGNAHKSSFLVQIKEGQLKYLKTVGAQLAEQGN